MAHGGPSKRKPNNNIDDNNSEDELPPAPDGGWGVCLLARRCKNFKCADIYYFFSGWVIVASSFLIHIISK